MSVSTAESTPSPAPVQASNDKCNAVPTNNAGSPTYQHVLIARFIHVRNMHFYSAKRSPISIASSAPNNPDAPKAKLPTSHAL